MSQTYYILLNALYIKYKSVLMWYLFATHALLLYNIMIDILVMS